ncbi:hypothetical protein Q4485_14470 [Granulosicoccaceae sp. 1_MG-2023]|nr:hypothetical protein [Granulosicoccaceae sp. 1_MG-2023]
MLHRYTSPQCLLCGEVGKLTYEHKIKGSPLANRFGKQELYFGSKDDFFIGKVKKLQSPKSKFLKFESPICEACNSRRTQRADRQFDSLLRKLNKAYETGIDPAQVFTSGLFYPGGEASLDLHRYFAKILCNFLADSECPIPERLSTFAINRSDEDCIYIGMEPNKFLSERGGLSAEFLPAEHKGLSIFATEDLELSHILSGVSFGAVIIYFWFYFTSSEKAELKSEYPDVYRRIRNLVLEHRAKLESGIPV